MRIGRPLNVFTGMLALRVVFSCRFSKLGQNVVCGVEFGSLLHLNSQGSKSLCNSKLLACVRSVEAFSSFTPM